MPAEWTFIILTLECSSEHKRIGTKRDIASSFDQMIRLIKISNWADVWPPRAIDQCCGIYQFAIGDAHFLGDIPDGVRKIHKETRGCRVGQLRVNDALGLRFWESDWKSFGKKDIAIHRQFPEFSVWLASLNSGAETSVSWIEIQFLWLIRWHRSSPWRVPVQRPKPPILWSLAKRIQWSWGKSWSGNLSLLDAFPKFSPYCTGWKGLQYATINHFLSTKTACSGPRAEFGQRGVQKTYTILHHMTLHNILPYIHTYLPTYLHTRPDHTIPFHTSMHAYIHNTYLLTYLLTYLHTYIHTYFQ